MALSDKVRNRLLNWKFEQAWQLMGDPSETVTAWEAQTVRALAISFGDPGWFDGAVADVVRAALWSVGVSEDGESVK